ncbi:hypothetical protein O9K51_00481 [Purpureocillium lavendulum]|uniref:Uncharacterized protein n=1 Tax=Purpureocillium lavendulum TaxID=1247861 RepID=A0AB34G390_9HYPO|nr:hypothetical protein O9K51_00481 [Purpureocillium lavendulum]
MAGFCQSTAGPADDRRRQPGQAVVRRDALPRHKEAPPALEQTPTIAPAAILAAASKLESFLRPTRVSLLQQRLAAAACARSGTR